MKKKKKMSIEQMIHEYHKKCRDFVEAKILETCGGELGRRILEGTKTYGKKDKN